MILRWTTNLLTKYFLLLTNILTYVWMSQGGIGRYSFYSNLHFSDSSWTASALLGFFNWAWCTTNEQANSTRIYTVVHDMENIRIEDPKTLWNLTFISAWTKRGNCGKVINYMGSLKKFENDFSQVCTEFSKSQPLILNNTNVLVKRQYFSCWNIIWKEDPSIVLVVAIFQVSLTQNCQSAHVG